MTLSLDEKSTILGPGSGRVVCSAGWLTSDFVVTPGARTRLQRWVDVGFPPSPDAGRTYINGPEPAIRRAIVNAIARIDVPPVRNHVSRNVVFMVTGRQTRGWQGLWPVFEHHVDEPPQVILVSGAETDPEELATIIGHEVGHTWLADVATESPAVADLADEDPGLLARLAGEWNIPDAALASALEPRRESERQAARLCSQWGFTGAASNPTGCAKRYRMPGE
jgi:hypothetical protein